MNLKTVQDASFMGNDWWTWRVWIDGPAPDLDAVESVTYRLHPTFPDPIRIVRDRVSQFRLEGYGWGEFSIPINVALKTGETHRLRHDLVLERPAPTSVRASAGATLPYHFISYSRVDAVVFGAGLRQALLDAEPPIHTWFDQFDLPPGADAEEAISQAVRDCESLLLVLTGEGADPTSAGEWHRALKYRKPILLLKVHTSAAVPEELANRVVIDFAGDYVAAATELRRRLLELDLPVGRLRAMRECLDDAERELARAADSRRRARIESDIAELRERIAEQECTIARPAEAARRVEESLERDLERERRPDREHGERAHGLAVPADSVPPYFKDREAEIQSIVDFLTDPSLRLLLVHGHGGSGKTALVQRVLRSVAQDRLPDGARVTLEGIVYLSAVGAYRVTLPTLYAELCGLLPPEAAADLRSLYRQEKVSAAAKSNALVKALAGKRALIVLDGLDAVLHPETSRFNEADLEGALQTMLSAPDDGLQIVITSRTVPRTFPDISLAPLWAVSPCVSWVPAIMTMRRPPTKRPSTSCAVRAIDSEKVFS